MTTPKEQHHKFLTRDQVLKMLEKARTSRGVRDYYLLAACFLLALRIGEAVALRSALFRLDDEVPHVLIPTEKRRPKRHVVDNYTGRPLLRVPILDGLPVLRSMQSWGSRRRWMFEGGSSSRCLSSRSGSRIFKRWAAEVGMPRVVSSHSLRHTAVSLLWRRTRDLALCRDFARHSSLKVTSEYVHAMPQEWRRAQGSLLG